MFYKFSFLLCLLIKNSAYADEQNRLLVKLKSGNSGNRYSRDVVYIKETIETDLELRTYNDDIDLDDEIRLLSEDSSVEFVEKDYLVSIYDTIPNDLKFNMLWGLDNKKNSDIGAVKAWDITTGSDKVVIGVIDTGIDYTHLDLRDNMWVNSGEIPGNNIDDDNNGFIDDIHGWDFTSNKPDGMDDHGHGTHCLGTIGATGDNSKGVVGVSWKVKLMALKFLNKYGYGYISDAIKAQNYATKMGANITSNSWGGWRVFTGYV